MTFHPQARPRNLVLVLGDQLNRDSAAFDGFDPGHDAVWMAEVAEESSQVSSHKARDLDNRHTSSPVDGRR